MSQFVNGFGLSKGCAALALKKPPPLFPRSLMTSCEATGPPTIVCCEWARVVTVWYTEKLSITPLARRISPPTTEIGSSSRNTQCVMSTQKLPSRSVRCRVNPRIRAIATTMPTAADMKFCTARPLICTT